MRKSFVAVLFVLLAGVASVALVAQTHDNAVEKKSSDEIRLTVDTMVAGKLLKAGKYLVACDKKTIKFSIIEVGPGIFTTTTKVLEIP